MRAIYCYAKREITIKVYTVDELTPEALERAREKYNDNNEFWYGNDVFRELQKICKGTGVEIRELDYTTGSAWLRVDELDEDEASETITLDWYAVETMDGRWNEFLTEKSPNTKSELQEVVRTFVERTAKELEAEYEHEQSTEYFIETARANEWEFYENGDIYK